MIVTPSGWIPENDNVLWTRGGEKLREGDLYVEGELIYLACEELRLYPFYTDLVPLEDWVGKRIAEVQPILGSRVILWAGGSPNGTGDLMVIRFEDGTRSVMFLEGTQVVKINERDMAPDIDLLVKSGFMSKEASRERAREIVLHKQLRDALSHAQKVRESLQKQLLVDPRRAWKATYALIEKAEAEIASCKKQLDREWAWAGWSFGLDYVTRWKSGLVDLFGWQDSGYHPFNLYVERMVPPAGRLITGVHRIFAPQERSDEGSKDVYVLEFEDETFSVSLGLAEGFSLELPLNSLLAAGLLSEKQYRFCCDRVALAQAEYDRVQKGLDRLRELKKQLDEHGLGLKQTRRILQEIALLEEASA